MGGALHLQPAITFWLEPMCSLIHTIPWTARSVIRPPLRLTNRGSFAPALTRSPPSVGNL
jgi:hypothetical protein